MKLNNFKVAIVYDRVNKWGGAERVLLTLHEMFPNAPLYTSVYDGEKASWARVFPKIHTSFLQKIPILHNYHELLGWLTPIAFEQFDFSKYDLVISVTSEAAKGIITGTNTKHICYMLTPTRHLWSGYDFYLKNPPSVFKIFPFYRVVSWPFLTYAKWWDRVTANRPDLIIANSKETQRRIKKYYKRESEVIYSPIPSLSNENITKKEKFYLIVNRLIPYKKVDLAIKVFNRLKKPLFVVGVGTEERRLKKIAKENIKFLGAVSDKKLFELYSRAKALIMPQVEDFGLVSVEAQSVGTPVIAFKKGGALETVINNKTGVFFDRQNEESLIKAIAKFEKMVFNHMYLRNNSQKFSQAVFKKSFLNLVRNI